MINWNEFDVLIYPDGNYSEMGNEKMLQWIRGGGKLIAMKNAVTELAGKKGFDLKNKEDAKKADKDIYEDLKAYEQRERENVSTNIPGAIYKVDLDNTHPLGFGFPNFYYTLKLDDKVYKYLSGGWNVGVIRKGELRYWFCRRTGKEEINRWPYFWGSGNGQWFCSLFS
jgi:hypothetical protein